MFNIFEQYWTLLITAIIAWRILDALFSDRHSWWQWLLLIVLLAASYILDRLLVAGSLERAGTVAILARILIIAAFLALLGLPAVQAILLREPRRWLWLLPPCLVVAAFAFDLLVRTDLERINALIKTAMKAVEQEDCHAIETAIAPDYSDSFHSSKEPLMRHCRKLLSQPLVEKNRKWALNVTISPPDATAMLTVRTTFEKDSFVAQTYKATMLTRMELTFQKQRDKSWLISRAEVRAIDMQQVGWRQVR
ncbi:MAG: hypothetical protein ACYTBJ_11125 [Planctomycetota bacterium]